MDEKNNAQTIADLAVLAKQHLLAGDDNGIPYVTLPQDARVESIEGFLENPVRFKADRKFVALESFCRYVSKFKLEGTMIGVYPNGNSLATIDATDAEENRWEEHKAHFLVTYSERWKTWDGLNKTHMSQKQFAEFVEDNLADFLAPKGADMLDIAKTLKAEQTANFKSGVSTNSGDVELSFVRTTTGKAGQVGQFEIPSEFEITIPILEGEPARVISMRLRYDLSQEGKLTLQYDILRRAVLLEEVRRSIYATIKNETGIEPYLML